MTQVDIGHSEPESPLMPKPTTITVKVFIDGLPFGEVVGERAIPADARQVARQILQEVEVLLRGTSYAH